MSQKIESDSPSNATDYSGVMVPLDVHRQETGELVERIKNMVPLVEGFRELLIGVAGEIVTLEKKAEHLKAAKKPWSASAAKTYAMTAQRLRFKLARNRKALKQFFRTVAPEEIVNLHNN